MWIDPDTGASHAKHRSQSRPLYHGRSHGSLAALTSGATVVVNGIIGFVGLVADVGFSRNAGELLVMQGASSADRSSLFKCLTEELSPGQGLALTNGRALHRRRALDKVAG